MAITVEQARSLDHQLKKVAKHYGIKTDGPYSSLIGLAAISMIIYAPKLVVISQVIRLRKLQLAQENARRRAGAGARVVGMDGAPIDTAASPVDVAEQMRDAPAPVAEPITEPANAGPAPMETFGFERV